MRSCLIYIHSFTLGHFFSQVDANSLKPLELIREKPKPEPVVTVHTLEAEGVSCAPQLPGTPHPQQPPGTPIQCLECEGRGQEQR